MKTLRLSMAASLLGLLAACSGGSTGKVSLMLTDAPGDFKAAVVTISEIHLVGDSGADLSLIDAPVTTNLIDLANDYTSIVKGHVIPAGHYSQLRFVITGACIAVEENNDVAYYASSTTYEGLSRCAVAPATSVDPSKVGMLRMPSYGTSGLKLDLPGGLDVAADFDAKLLIDFDVAQSFGHEAGNSGAWVMHPVMTATEFQLSGTLDVTLQLKPGVELPTGYTLGMFTATATNAAGSMKELPLTQAVANGPWSASFQYLIPGPFTVSLIGPAQNGTQLLTFTTEQVLPSSVEVLSGQPTSTVITLTGVAVAP